MLPGVSVFLYLVLLLGVNCQVYVDSNSQCGETCTGNSSSPFLTILSGLNSVPSGGKIILQDGVYKGIGNKNLNISSSFVTISSENGPASTIIDCENDGYGFELFSGTFSISGITVRNCNRKFDGFYENRNYGGGAFTIHSTYTELTNMVLTNNNATYLGGAVYSASMKVVNSTVNGNSVKGAGGGFFITSGNLHLTNTKLEGNKATINGSDIFCLSASVQLYGDSDVSGVDCTSCTITLNDYKICPVPPNSSASTIGFSWAIVSTLLAVLYFF